MISYWVSAIFEKEKKEEEEEEALKGQSYSFFFFFPRQISFGLYVKYLTGVQST